MLRDVFYYGKKPNAHPREQYAENLEDARLKATTRDFWIINEFCDYRNFDWDFDFEFLPDEDVWAEDHNNVWPSQHQKDSGTWLCPKEHSDIIIYRGDVDPVIRKNEKQSENWVELDLIDHSKFDFSWHPDPTDPPYIYKWGCKFFPAQFKHVLEYRVPGATQEKYMDIVVELLPEWDKWFIPDDVSKEHFDFTWRPNPMDPPFIYEFGTQWQRNGGPIYTATGATDRKYINDQKAKKLPSNENWTVPDNIDISGFDFSWHPDNTSPPYVYVFATQWALSGGPVYTVPGATEIKYIEDQSAVALPNMNNWVFDENEIDIDSFDFSWHPYAADGPFIYQFGTQWWETGGPKYIAPGADSNSPVKYIDTRILKAILKPNKDNWDIPANLDVSEFDFSWVPHPEAPPYIYEFGTQWQKTGGPRYVVPGATETSYVDIMKAKRLPDLTNWDIPANLIIDTEKFDLSWHPDDTVRPFIYQFDTQWALRGGPRYVVPGATEVSYVEDIIAYAGPCLDNWEYNEKLLDVSEFDFSWHPYVDEDQPYIYQFGTQWQKTGGPRYVVPGATQVKYVDTRILKAKRLPNMDNWEIPEKIDVKSFDFSWHPDETEDPYIYEFGTQWHEVGGPRYVVSGATQIKYIDTNILKATLLPDMTNWTIPENVTTWDFDFSWVPHPDAPPYIYKFGTQWAMTGGPIYTVPGATEVSYVEDMIVTAGPCMDNWEIPDDIAVDEFDFSWHPYSEDDPFIYQFGTQWQKTGGPRYVVPGATQVKYVDTRILKARKLPNHNSNWVIPDNVDITDFDFSWHPDDTEASYIYKFGTQWALSGGPSYVVPSATEIKYVDSPIAKSVVCMDNWEIPDDIAADEFDFSWHPYSEDDPFIYQFGTQWQKTGGPRYVVPGATQIKYVDTRIIKARKLPNRSLNWSVPDNIDATTFDFSWHPDDTESPYIYKFGTQWQKNGGPTYTIPDATEVKYVNSPIAKATVCLDNWEIPEGINEYNFDFSWHPDGTEEPYVYQFGTQWYEIGGPRYHAPGSDENSSIKYIDPSVLKATLLPDYKNWEIPDGIDTTTFDFSWVPHPSATPYVYQFGTSTDPNDGPKYITPGTNGEILYVPRIEKEANETAMGRYYISTTLEDLVNEHPNEIFWALSKDVNYDDFDFDWKPELSQLQYVNVFGPSDSPKLQTYWVNSVLWNQGLRELSFIDAQETKTIMDLDVFFVDKGNSEAAARYEQLKNVFGNKLQKTRYLNSWVDTINRCTNRATSNIFWVLNSELDYSNFDFDYYPNPWQMKMVHVFGTQWSHWGTTFMINRETFSEDTKYIKIIEHLGNLNFVKERRATATSCLYDVLLIDHGNSEITQVQSQIQSKIKDKSINTVSYDESYLNTIRNYVKKLPEKKEHYMWICSSVCDYSDFDFSYICDPYAKENLHVFPSGSQKFGDTFLIDVNKTKEIISDLGKLEEYNKVNYNGTVKAKRLPEPIIVTQDDTLVNVVKNITGFPYATIITGDNKNIETPVVEPMNLWSPDTKNIIVTSTGATRVIAPKEAKDYIDRELYEYPYIKRSPKLIKSNPMDIVFLSNGETKADENWEHLLNVTKGLANRVVRVDGINGRVAAYHAAAEASETPWMFTVFAKLKVSPKFDWNWQPDRMQVPKHYIFHAKNPVNGLVYGHQAMIAYNKNLTLANEGKGLDFTLDDEHETVPLISGTAHYNTDEFSTWRTAFREVLKLKADNSEESQARLDAWLNKAEGDFAEYSIKGALDADEYYDEVEGDFDKLKLSYEWSWLRDRFDQM